MCELVRTAAETRHATSPASVSSGYHEELHEGCLHSACKSQTELQLFSTKRDPDRHWCAKLTIFVQEHDTGPIFSKYCRYVSLTLMTSSLAFPPVRWNVVTVMEHLCFQSRCLPHWDHFLCYCATHKQPRLFCLRLQDSVEFGLKITYIFEWECRMHSQQFGVPLTVCSCKFFTLIFPGWNSRLRSQQIPLLGKCFITHYYKGQGFFTRRGWFRIGNIKGVGFQRFSQNWSFKSPPSLDLPYPPTSVMVNL